MPDASAPAPSAARPKRKKGKRPAGSKWLNYLLCLGCLGSLSPLCFEYWTHFRQPDRVLAKPHKNDEWVRIIDAAAPEEALKSKRSGEVQKRFRHHPRHGRSTARVTADGTMEDADDEAPEDSAELERASTLEERLRKRAESGKPSSLHAAAGAPPSAATATATVAASANATVESSSSSSIGAHAAAVINASAGGHDDDDLADLRRVDRETAAKGGGGAGTFTARPGVRVGMGAPRFGAGLNGTERLRSSRLWRTIPGGIHDIIEGVGPNQTVFSVSGIPPPSLINGSYVTDLTNSIDGLTKLYMNRNLTWVDRLTPFRVLFLLLEKQPRDWASRHQYAMQLLRHWYAGSRMLDRTALIVMSLDGSVEIAVGHQCRLVLSEGVAHHFAVKAMEMIKMVQHTGTEGGHGEEVRPMAQRVTETAQKLVYYVSFTVRTRTQATAMSMRSMSMFMMMFMMMTIVATKQQQARRYAELYGYDPYSGRRVGYGLRDPYGRNDPFGGDFLWDEFESGRRGAMLQAQRERAHADAFFRLQILQMLLAQRGREVEDDSDEEEDDEMDGEEEMELLTQASTQFYEEERRERENASHYR